MQTAAHESAWSVKRDAGRILSDAGVPFSGFPQAVRTKRIGKKLTNLRCPMI